jgi:ADP-ribosyl-[dinitrogen reductase] hydrolase
VKEHAVPVDNHPVETASRFAGCLLGGAIGDALGAPVEFDTLTRIRAAFGPDGVQGYQPAYGHVGTITDDTQMTLFTAEGLLRAEARRWQSGDADSTDFVARAYRRWYATQGGTPHAGDGWLLSNRGLHARRAPGNTCLGALSTPVLGTPTEPINDSKGCGAVMRVAPIGLVAHEPFALAATTGALTHGHPSGYLSAAALASIISSVVHGNDLTSAIERACDELRAWPGHEETLHAIQRAVRTSVAGPSAERLESIGAGWVGEEALAIGLYCALTTDDVREALLLAVNHSGDSDSTGSITGNLLGAIHGVEALPPDLLADVEMRVVIHAVAIDLDSAFVLGTPPDPRRYPPW